MLKINTQKSVNLLKNNIVFNMHESIRLSLLTLQRGPPICSPRVPIHFWGALSSLSVPLSKVLHSVKKKKKMGS